MNISIALIAMAIARAAGATQGGVRVEHGPRQYSLKGGNPTIAYTDRLVGRGLTRKQVLRAQRSPALRFTGPHGMMEGISAAEEHNDGRGRLTAHGLAPNAVLRRLVGGTATHQVEDNDGHASLEASGSRINRGYGVADVGRARRLPNGETEVEVYHTVTSEAGYYPPPGGVEAFVTTPFRLAWEVAKQFPWLGAAPRAADAALGAFIVWVHGRTVDPATGYARIINQKQSPAGPRWIEHSSSSR
jgi:hypothetical protein